MLKTKLSHWLRRTGLLYGVDRAYYFFNKIKFSSRNRKFLNENPSIKLPQPYVLYEAYRMDYRSYFEDGKHTAQDIVQLLSSHISLENKTLLDWGCGPARVVRHLPALLPNTKLYGSDYNMETVKWCKENIEGVEFEKNELLPPLNFSNDFFEVIYALSVFTHLSEENHHKWMEELYRIIKPGGVFLFTTQGNAFANKLSESEKNKFLDGQLVVRGKVKEGHRTFSAFQPEKFMYSLFLKRWKVLNFIPGSIHNWGPAQDMWVIEKINGDNDK